MKVLDFGVAKLMHDGALDMGPRAQTVGQIKIFAPAYGAPEQFDDRIGAVGAASDVYSFALILLEALRDKNVVEGTHLGEFAKSTRDPQRRPTPRALGIDVPDEVEQTFARATALDPAQRWQTAGDFWQSLTIASKLATERKYEVAARETPPLAMGGLPRRRSGTLPARAPRPEARAAGAHDATRLGHARAPAARAGRVASAHPDDNRDPVPPASAPRPRPPVSADAARAARGASRPTRVRRGSTRCLPRRLARCRQCLAAAPRLGSAACKVTGNCEFTEGRRGGGREARPRHAAACRAARGYDDDDDARRGDEGARARAGDAPDARAARCRRRSECRCPGTRRRGSRRSASQANVSRVASTTSTTSPRSRMRRAPALRRSVIRTGGRRASGDARASFARWGTMMMAPGGTFGGRRCAGPAAAAATQAAAAPQR